MMAVIGGLGSPAGVVAGAVAVIAGRILLPGAWGFLTSGAGVLLVLIFRPAGLSGILQWIRDGVVRLLVPGERERERAPAPPRAPVRESVA